MPSVAELRRQLPALQLLHQVEGGAEGGIGLGGRGVLRRRLHRRPHHARRGVGQRPRHRHRAPRPPQRRVEGAEVLEHGEGLGADLGGCVAGERQDALQEGGGQGGGGQGGRHRQTHLHVRQAGAGEVPQHGVGEEQPELVEVVGGKRRRSTWWEEGRSWEQAR